MNVDFEKQSIAEIKTNFTAAELYLIEIIEIENSLNAKTNRDKQIKDTSIKYTELELEGLRALNTDSISLYQHLKEAETYAERNDMVNTRIATKNALNDLNKLTPKLTSVLNRMKDLNLEPLDTEMKIEITGEINSLEESVRELERTSIELQKIVDNIR